MKRVTSGILSTHQHQLAVLAYTAKAISSTTSIVKRNMSDERRMALASSHHSGLPSRIDGDEVVLSPNSDKARVGRPGDLHNDQLALRIAAAMALTQLSAPK